METRLFGHPDIPKILWVATRKQRQGVAEEDVRRSSGSQRFIPFNLEVEAGQQDPPSVGCSTLLTDIDVSALEKALKAPPAGKEEKYNPHMRISADVDIGGDLKREVGDRVATWG